MFESRSFYRMIRVQAVLVQHWPCDGEILTISRRFLKIKIHSIRDLFSYPCFSIDFFCCRHHLFHISHVEKVMLIYRKIRYDAGWRCNHYQSRVKTLFPACQGMSYRVWRRVSCIHVSKIDNFLSLDIVM